MLRFKSRGRGLDQDVVDQPRAADAGGDREQDRPAVELGDRGEVVGVARLEVLGLDPGGRELGAGRVDRRPAATPPGRARSAARSARESAAARSRSPGLQVGVARAHRQPVGLAHGRQPLDPDGDVEVADHAPDHRQLLGVLLAEVGDLGLDRVEELGDDGGDAAEVPGAAPRRVAVEHLGQALDLDRGREALGIDLLDRGRVDVVDAGLGGEPRVALLVARVAVEVLARRRTGPG